ncbi:MAG: 4-(cytidine 5'-diphospho)-2-C-methyl-D-erythritol kinase [Sphingobacteriaceae bacterium]
MICFPNAKINIGLNIIERRPDGYHNLESVFYPVRINDALEVVEAGELQFTSSGLDIPGKLEDNLCVKAFYLLKQDFNIPPVHIHLHKHIPIGAGLGGGSADAAFFIKLMNEKFDLGLGVEQMEAYARKLGADCAFFIQNEPVYAFAKGDEFEPVKLDLNAYYLVLVMPDVTVSTGMAYSGIKPLASSQYLPAVVQLPLEEWKKSIKNDFETSVFGQYPVIRGIKAALYESGAMYAAMSGSGSSVYGIFKQPVQLPELEKNYPVFYGI